MTKRPDIPGRTVRARLTERACQSLQNSTRSRHVLSIVAPPVMINGLSDSASRIALHVRDEVIPTDQREPL